MIPLRDNIPSRTVPFVNYILIGINVLVFLLEMSMGENLQQVVHTFGVVPQRTITIAFQTPQYLHLALFPFLTSMFLHGGILHLLGNMLYLFIFGDNVEDRLGHFRYLLFYLGCGVAAALAHLLLNLSSDVPTIGASGAIAGVLGAYFLLFPRARVVTILPIFYFIQIVEIPAVIFLGIWFLMQFLTGSMAQISNQGAAGVAWWAHVGGFVAGAAYTLLRYRVFRKG
ncbi:MAG: rhomboid family intramembrane serine protease [bacterium]|nr:MAG: rhomboid family intramembrane serine protease [bacterium]